MQKNEDKAKLRFKFIMLSLLYIGFSSLILRLAYLQIIKHNEYKSRVEKQYIAVTKLKPKRGMIYDRNMVVLAKSADVWDVVVSPKTFKDDDQRKKAGEWLSDFLKLDKDKVINLLEKPTYYEIIKRRIEKPIYEKIREYKIKNNMWAIYLKPSTKRYYFHKDFLANVLGFVGNDEEGLEGLEYYYNRELKGLEGKIINGKNAWGTDMFNSTQASFNAQDGNSLVLTIDANIQEALEKNLKDAVEQYSIKNRAVGIVMNVNTGEILAMSTKPDYDPNQPFEVFDESKKEELAKIKDEKEYKETRLKFLNEQWRNKAISDPYEPGSVFKMIVAAAALEENVINVTDEFHCSGHIKIGDKTINCWRNEGHGKLDFSGALINSCNPSFATVGLKLKQNKFIKYFNAFGFRELTGIDLPGESNSIFHKKENFIDHTLAISSIGQSFKVTPLQMITAASTAVNGGKLVKPHIVKQIIDSNRNIIRSEDTIVKRQVISKKVSKFIAETCEKVISEIGAGGRQAYREGQRRGGKTGTAEQLDKQVGGKVINYTLSFLVYAPANNPQIAILILLDTPQVGELWGSVMAVPVGGKVLDYVYKYMDLEQIYENKDKIKSICVPNLEGKKIEEAKNILTKANLQYSILGDGDKVKGQLPIAGSYVQGKSVITISTGSDEDVNFVEVPDLIGNDLEQARTILNKLGLNIFTLQDNQQDQEKKNKTKVTKQTPEAGEKVKPGSVIQLEFVNSEDTIVG